MTKEKYIQFIRSVVESDGIELYNLHKDVIRQTFQLSDSKEYSIYNTEKNVELSRDITDTYTITKNMSLSEALIRMATCAVTVANTDFSEKLMEDGSFNFAMKNGHGDLVIKAIGSSNFYSTVFLINI